MKSFLFTPDYYKMSSFSSLTLLQARIQCITWHLNIGCPELLIVDLHVPSHNFAIRVNLLMVRNLAILIVPSPQERTSV